MCRSPLLPKRFYAPFEPVNRQRKMRTAGRIRPTKNRVSSYFTFSLQNLSVIFLPNSSEITIKKTRNKNQMNPENNAVGAPKGGFFGHPRGLATLFFTEMWERFSFYGLRPLLILFIAAAVMQGGWGWDRDVASEIVGIYASFVYLASLPGGWIADKWLGLR